ncbi:nicotinate-nucleotide adenylyltransferase [Micromonospora sp. ATCC 39149]|uniref:Nicotinate-nucleotide adenylyltransferase n=1 Tax=Micromonospora carbonacea TaxID=47853 RepID=A0A7D6CBC5_9ACTN|nr:nicotinate-nucleotide adenylyltransferase [Micromonospora sp. ATCC 39149]QLJ96945.1 nicotinate-nucleotide adenylyltransferase [Micromonospora carbonacea]
MTDDRNDVVDVASAHGRFQPLHLGHLEYLLAAARRCRTLVVGITNPDPWQVRSEPSAPHREAGHANPFTFYERLSMVDGALRDSGLPDTAFRVVPFPHSFPERLGHYLPANATVLLTIYDGWGEEKLRRFRAHGWRTEVLWRRDTTVTSGTDLRRRLRDGLAWDHLVPPATARVVRDLPATHPVFAPERHVG